MGRGHGGRRWVRGWEWKTRPSNTKQTSSEEVKHFEATKNWSIYWTCSLSRTEAQVTGSDSEPMSFLPGKQSPTSHPALVPLTGWVWASEPASFFLSFILLLSSQAGPTPEEELLFPTCYEDTTSRLSQKPLAPLESLLSRYRVKSQWKWVLISKSSCFKAQGGFFLGFKNTHSYSSILGLRGRCPPTARGLLGSQATATLLSRFTLRACHFLPTFPSVILQNDITHVTINLKPYASQPRLHVRTILRSLPKPWLPTAPTQRFGFRSSGLGTRRLYV